jgi:hypothetical protein
MARRKTPRARRPSQNAKRGGAGRPRARSASAARKRTAARKSTTRAARARKARLRKASARQARAGKVSKKQARQGATAAQARSRKASASGARARKASAGQTRKAASKAVTRTAQKAVRATSAAVRPPSSPPAFVARKAPSLDRERRIVRDDDDVVPTPPSSLNMDRSASAARSGRRGLHERFKEHTETSPAITGGDVDADWESAYSVGDEAPGGDNPTPDQDIVDDIGRAIGVQYEDNEELKGEKKILERDRKRWELDPASSEDYKDR